MGRWAVNSFQSGVTGQRFKWEGGTTRSRDLRVATRRSGDVQHAAAWRGTCCLFAPSDREPVRRGAFIGFQSSAPLMEYQPGVCNIGRAERQKRRRLGLLAFLGAGGYVALVVGTGRPDTFLLGAFGFLFGGFLSVLQDRLHFCAGFAALARYDLSESGGAVERVTEREALRQDRFRAVQIVAYAAAAAAVSTAVVYAVGTAL